VPTVERVAVLLQRDDGRWLMVQRPPEGLLASLYELPSVDLDPGQDPAGAATRLARRLGTRARLEPRGAAEHQFSHRRWRVHTFATALRRGWRGRELPKSARWVDQAALTGLGVPTASRKVLRAAGV
jgi:A/G-specific adenine glycosylase